MLVRSDPSQELDRFNQQVSGTAARPAVMPMDARRVGDNVVLELGIQCVPADGGRSGESVLESPLRPEVIGLFAEVDAILCAAAERMVPRLPPPAPPATECAAPMPRWDGRAPHPAERVWRRPACRVWVNQRSPPRTASR